MRAAARCRGASLALPSPLPPPWAMATRVAVRCRGAPCPFPDVGDDSGASERDLCHRPGSGAVGLAEPVQVCQRERGLIDCYLSTVSSQFERCLRGRCLGDRWLGCTGEPFNLSKCGLRCPTCPGHGRSVAACQVQAN